MLLNPYNYLCQLIHMHLSEEILFKTITKNIMEMYLLIYVMYISKYQIVSKFLTKMQESNEKSISIVV